jgi:hypothetical protein
MSNVEETDDQLHRKINDYERYAVVGGAAVILGLLVEVGIAYEYADGKSSIEHWGTVCADGLVALGVFFEILFSWRSRLKSEKLQRRSDERVAEANERAGRAEEGAERAKLESEQIKQQLAWRVVSSNVSEELIRQLQNARNSVILEHVSGDVESQYLAGQYVRIFQEAGWYVSIRSVSGSGLLKQGIIISQNEMPLMRGVIITSFRAAQISFNVDTLGGGAGLATTAGNALPNSARVFFGPKPLV